MQAGDMPRACSTDEASSCQFLVLMYLRNSCLFCSLAQLSVPLRLSLRGSLTLALPLSLVQVTPTFEELHVGDNVEVSCAPSRCSLHIFSSLNASAPVRVCVRTVIVDTRVFHFQEGPDRLAEPRPSLPVPAAASFLLCPQKSGLANFILVHISLSTLSSFIFLLLYTKFHLIFAGSPYHTSVRNRCITRMGCGTWARSRTKMRSLLRWPS